MEHIGYFQVLPRELITELHKYFSRYFKSKELIWLNTYMAAHEQIDNQNQYLNSYTFDIVIGDKFDLPFAIQLPILKLFLETAVLEHSFIFIDFKKLKIENFVPNVAIKDNDIYSAQVAHLNSNLKDFKLSIIHEEEQFCHFWYWHPEGYPTYIYKCDLLETEVLIYKLIQFYNDIIRWEMRTFY